MRSTPQYCGKYAQLPVSPDGHLDNVSALNIAPVEPARDNVGIEKDSPLDGAEPCILNLGIEPLEPGGAEKSEKAGLDCGAKKPEKYSPLVDEPIALRNESD